MLARLTKHYDRKRLRLVLATLFVTLAAPTVVLVWLGFGQLKWEAFYQARAQAEALNNRIDNALGQKLGVAESRKFSDFAYFNVTQSGALLQRSPLAELPVAADVPGVVGYFQVDAEGGFSTPLLPDPSTSGNTGLTADELAARAALAGEIHRVLSANELVRQNTAGNAPAAARAESVPPGPAEQAVAEREEARFAQAQSNNLRRQMEPSTRDSDANAAAYSQSVFEDLNLGSGKESVDRDTAASISAGGRERVADLRLDDALLKKSEEVSSAAEITGEDKLSSQAAPNRDRRNEIVKLPQTAPAIATDTPELDALDEIAITTFSSEIDPYEFSILQSGNFVLFRNVWRDNERFIQGLLLDQVAFLESTIKSPFQSAPLATVADLVIAYEGDIVDVSRAAESRNYLDSSRGLEGTLLYQRALSAPFDRIELIYSINKLPRGPGATVLSWAAIATGVVFVAGFFALYRLGLSQIRLARQQQDFVSAVSHELKTPLTSIRMYGEILKEGWADEAKQKQYFKYIHDEAERLSRLISNVLQLASISRNDPDISLAPVTGAELLSVAETKLASHVENAGFELRLDAAADARQATVNIDTDCFAQIMINIVDNAIKFSRDATDKYVDLKLQLRTDGQLVFSVRDYGPGVAPDQIKRIFNLFYRPASELTRETVGTGIGLAIVHQLVSLMHGSVDVINTDPGARFDISFPGA